VLLAVFYSIFLQGLLSGIVFNRVGMQQFNQRGMSLNRTGSVKTDQLSGMVTVLMDSIDIGRAGDADIRPVDCIASAVWYHHFHQRT
jgi:hypothetical protein